MNQNSLLSKPIIELFSSSPSIDGKSTSIPSVPLVVNNSVTSKTLSLVSKNGSNEVSLQIPHSKPAPNKKILYQFWNPAIEKISHGLASWFWIDSYWKHSSLNSCSSCVRNPIVESWWKTDCKMIAHKIDRENYQKACNQLIPRSLRNKMDDALKEISDCERKINLLNALKVKDTAVDASKAKEISSKATAVESISTDVPKSPEEPVQVDDTFVRSKIFKVSPNRKQKRLLHKFFRARKDTFNLCLAEIKKRNMKGFPEMNALRKTCVNADALIFTKSRYAYMLTVPQAIRNNALMDVLKAYKTEFAKCRKDSNHTFKIKFRSKKSTQSFVIDARAWKRSGIFYPRFWTKNIPLKCCRPLPDKLNHAAVVKRTPLGEYFIHIPHDAQSRISEKLDLSGKAPQYSRIVSIDPGVRTPFTCYDPCGKTYKMAPDGMKKIDEIHRRMDKLQSKFDSKEIRSRKRYRYKKAWKRMEKRKQNLIKEFHVKTALYLCRNYEVILLPDFETQEKVRKARRSIGKKTVRQLLAWSHYNFRVILEQKAELFGSKVIICDEQYTSKTCSDCGNIKKDLGGAKEYDCVNCGYQVDRDESAAKNILLRYIRKITPRSRVC